MFGGPRLLGLAGVRDADGLCICPWRANRRGWSEALSCSGSALIRFHGALVHFFRTNTSGFRPCFPGRSRAPVNFLGYRCPPRYSGVHLHRVCRRIKLGILRRFRPVGWHGGIKLPRTLNRFGGAVRSCFFNPNLIGRARREFSHLFSRQWQPGAFSGNHIHPKHIGLALTHTQNTAGPRLTACIQTSRA